MTSPSDYCGPIGVRMVPFSPGELLSRSPDVHCPICGRRGLRMRRNGNGTPLGLPRHRRPR